MSDAADATLAYQTMLRLVEKVDPHVAQAIRDELTDQRGSLKLIASENYASITTLLSMGTCGSSNCPGEERTPPLDWTFERLETEDPLRPFEQTLLDVLAPVGGVAASVSKIVQPIEDVIPKIQDQLYDDVVRRGWFAQRPDSTRRKWATLAWGALVLSAITLGILMMFTQFGLLGLALVIISLGLVFVAQEMPRRTAKGAAMMRGLELLAMELQTQQLEQIPKATRIREISQLLPYAVVLGGKDRWLQALVEADDDPGVPDGKDLDWYHAPGEWHMDELPAAIKGFLVTMQGELYGRD